MTTQRALTLRLMLFQSIWSIKWVRMPLTTRQRNLERKTTQKIKLIVAFLICLILWRAHTAVASTHSAVKRGAIILLYLSYTTNDATVPPRSRQFLFHFILLLLNLVRCMTFGFYCLVLRTSSTQRPSAHSFTHVAHANAKLIGEISLFLSHISFIRISFFFRIRLAVSNGVSALCAHSVTA